MSKAMGCYGLLGRVNTNALNIDHVDGPLCLTANTAQTSGTRCRGAVHTNNDDWGAMGHYFSAYGVLHVVLRMRFLLR
jgi:hypothetical protein